MNKHKQAGFTLIELMIVVAILGIISSIALPSYQDYTTKARVQESMLLVGGLSKKVQAFFEKEGSCPNNSSVVLGDIYDSYGIADNDDLKGYSFDSINVKVGSAETLNGGCSIETLFKSSGFNKELQGKKVSWELYDMDLNAPKWACFTDAGATSFKFLPKFCRYVSLSSSKAGF